MGIPFIESYQFGQIIIDGQVHKKDVIIMPDRIISKWWRQEGHLLQTVDIELVLQARPSFLIVGKGAYGKLKIGDDADQALQEAGIQVIAQPTGEAWQTYNEMRETGQVAAALHLTC
ncbi:MAG: hypothetical protein JXA42_08940 [Anaerolineales bacterium]|nr:hypothetical protein [Anaerolineales bacterium]